MLTLCTIEKNVASHGPFLSGPTVTPHTSPRPQRRSRKPPSGADNQPNLPRRLCSGFALWGHAEHMLFYIYIYMCVCVYSSNIYHYDPGCYYCNFSFAIDIHQEDTICWWCWLPSIGKLVESHQQFYTIVGWNMWHAKTPSTPLDLVAGVRPTSSHITSCKGFYISLPDLLPSYIIISNLYQFLWITAAKHLQFVGGQCYIYSKS